MNIERLKKSIGDVISGKDNDSALSKLLTGVSGIYGRAMDLRFNLYQNNRLKIRRLPCPVISVGNITLGGTGKTPMTIYLARLVQNMGMKPAIVCRGYKGTYEHSMGVVTDGMSVFLNPQEAGDEPYLMASQLSGVPVVVGKDRYASGLKAWRSFHPDVIICDDAFQHLRLFRDLDLVLMDASDPVGNGQIFPRGVLREPLHQLSRADALILTRAETQTSSASFLAETMTKSGKPVFRCCHVANTVSVLTTDGCWKKCSPGILRGKTCTAFAGIAKNEGFLQMLSDSGCRVKGFVSFPDHHRFSSKDIEFVLETARKNRVEFLITTEKDRVRLPEKMVSSGKVYCLGIRISFIGKDDIRFREFICRGIRNLK